MVKLLGIRIIPGTSFAGKSDNRTLFAYRNRAVACHTVRNVKLMDAPGLARFMPGFDL